MFCKKCGNQLLEDEKFCSSCGAPIEEITNTNPVETGMKRKKKFSKKTVIIVVVVVILLLCILGSGDPVSDIKNSTLPAYSEDITIGEAFEDFFSHPSWSLCDENDKDVVVFKGYFYEESGDKIKITMEMTMREDKLKWEEVVLYNTDSGDTTYLTDLELESLLNAIYEDGTFTWYW